jgi:hypothetical protein
MMSLMQFLELLGDLMALLGTGRLIIALCRFDARAAVFAPFPSSLDQRIVEALKAHGVQQLHSHPARAFDTVAKGEHLVVVPQQRPRKRSTTTCPCSRRWCS